MVRGGGGRRCSVGQRYGLGREESKARAAGVECGEAGVPFYRVARAATAVKPSRHRGRRNGKEKKGGMGSVGWLGCLGGLG
jgi:hypothetical protein